jgi:protoporphyrinogen oxidase
VTDVETLIIGAGVTGLAAAGRLEGTDYLVLEADDRIGGYCKTTIRDGFVWDHAGHFFHFRQPETERWLRDRMDSQRIENVRKKSKISYAGRLIEYPFQKNIHQLPADEFLECLHDLYFAQANGGAAVDPDNLSQVLLARYGDAICKKFLFPYNEKVYTCDLATLDVGAMGRFFPSPDVDDVIRNFLHPSDDSYNATFTYPELGAFEYVKALATAVDPAAIRTGEAVVALDINAREATTASDERISFDRVISSMPLPRLATMTGVAFDAAAFSWSKVLVFNLGFDRKGPPDIHWIYVPSEERSFYRVGFYDNILGTDRMSLYVEVGMPGDAEEPDLLPRVLDDLRAEGIVEASHELVASETVMLDPGYVHLTPAALLEAPRLCADLASKGVYSVGRYGAWRYCSIEDNILEAWALVDSFERSA